MAIDNNFEDAYKSVKKSEGGISKDTFDNGNYILVNGKKEFIPTRYGLTFSTWLTHNKKTLPKTKAQFKTLTKEFNTINSEDVKQDFKTFFWDKFNLGKITDLKTATNLLDASINQNWTYGKNASNLKKALGITGNTNTELINNLNSLISKEGSKNVNDKFTAQRIKKYKISATYNKHGKSWLTRIKPFVSDAMKTSIDTEIKNINYKLTKDDLIKRLDNKNYKDPIKKLKGFLDTKNKVDSDLKNIANEYKKLVFNYSDPNGSKTIEDENNLRNFIKKNEDKYGKGIIDLAIKDYNALINNKFSKVSTFSAKNTQFGNELKDLNNQITKLETVNPKDPKIKILKNKLFTRQEKYNNNLVSLNKEIYSLQSGDLEKKINDFKGDVNSQEFKDLQKNYKHSIGLYKKFQNISPKEIKETNLSLTFDSLQTYIDNANSKKLTKVDLTPPPDKKTPKDKGGSSENKTGIVLPNGTMIEKGTSGNYIDPTGNIYKQDNNGGWVKTGDVETIAATKDVNAKPIKPTKPITAKDSVDAFFNTVEDPTQQIEPTKEYQGKKGFLDNVPLDAIASGLLGITALGEANVDIPKRDEEISQSVLSFIAENKKLSEIGLRPEEELAAKQQIAGAYQTSIDNITRASGGNRNLLLGNLSKVNESRIHALTSLAIADAQAKQKALQDYGKGTQYINDFYTNRSIANHQIDMNEANNQRMAAGQLASASFSNMINAVNDAKQNGPGSINNLLTQTIFNNLEQSKNKQISAAEYSLKDIERQKQISFLGDHRDLLTEQQKSLLTKPNRRNIDIIDGIYKNVFSQVNKEISTSVTPPVQKDLLNTTQSGSVVDEIVSTPEFYDPLLLKQKKMNPLLNINGPRSTSNLLTNNQVLQ